MRIYGQAPEEFTRKRGETEKSMFPEPLPSASLTGWLRRASTVRGIHFAGSGDQWMFHTYAEIASAASGFAEQLLNRGLAKGDVVLLIQHSGFAATVSFFGAILAGGVPALVPPPNVFEKAQDFKQRTTLCLRAARPRFIVAAAGASPILEEIANQTGHAKILPVECLLKNAGQVIWRETSPNELAFLQFTSGSSGSSRSVGIPFRALDSNVAAIHRWLEWKESDSTASWLPLHHDMGLVGCYLGAVTMQSELWLLEPEHFIRSPIRYLKCFGEAGAVLTALPNFALDYIARRVGASALAGMDFSAWRAAIIGGEPVRVQSLTAFHGLLAPFGFRRESLLPAYGLAEATLAVTGLPLFRGWRKITVDPASLMLGERVILKEESSQTSTLVGCGHSLSGTSVSIQDDAGNELSQGHLGQIIVRGNSLAAGYLGSSTETATIFEENTLRTGDTGFFLDGELFVIGRLGDSVKVRGRAVFAEDLEAALSVLKIPAHRFAVLAGSLHANVSMIIVLIEHPANVEHSCVEGILKARIGDARLSVRHVPQGVLRRTTSGKVRRRELWREMLQEEIRCAVQADMI